MQEKHTSFSRWSSYYNTSKPSNTNQLWCRSCGKYWKNWNHSWRRIHYLRFRNSRRSYQYYNQFKQTSKVDNHVEVSAGNGGEKYNVSFGYPITKKLNAQISYLRDNQNLYFKNTYRNSDYFTAGIFYQVAQNQSLSLRYSTLSEKGKFVRNINYKNYKNMEKL